MATIDSQKIFKTMPQIAKADTLLIVEQKRYSKEFEQKQIEVENQLQIADSLYRINSNSETTLKAVALSQKLLQESDDLKKALSKKLDDFKELLYRPYLDKIDEAIKIVALRRKFMQVIDIQKVPFTYINDTSDITNDVIKELKIKGTRN